VLFLEAPIVYPTFNLLADFRDNLIVEIPGYPLKHKPHRFFKGKLALKISDCSIGDMDIKNGYIYAKDFEVEVPHDSNTLINMEMEDILNFQRKNDDEYKYLSSIFKGILTFKGKYRKGRHEYLLEGFAKGSLKGDIDGDIHAKFYATITGNK
jgi:hypothetical protein